MSQPTVPEHVFEAIRAEAVKSGRLYDGPDVLFPWVEQQMQSAAAKFPFMVGKTEKDYITYVHDRRVSMIRATITQGVPSDQQFWKAAYDYDPKNGQRDLLRMIATGRMKDLTLGKLYGKYTLKLLPAIGALRVFDPNFDCDLEYAATDSTAIFYPGQSSSNTFLNLGLKFV